MSDDKPEFSQKIIDYTTAVTLIVIVLLLGIPIAWVLVHGYRWAIS